MGLSRGGREQGPNRLWLDRHSPQQEAELSLRDRPMLGVTEYFAVSLKVIRNDTQTCSDHAAGLQLRLTTKFRSQRTSHMLLYSSTTVTRRVGDRVPSSGH